ncbi:MAG: pseudouridine synthase [Oligoflexia bacterium]|nr:pseudouridine synthase [Oligoflexia bacterium]
MLTFKTLYEDSWILVVDKPSGFYSHSPDQKKETRRISPRWNGLSVMKNSTGLKNLSPIHRLDQKTSGLWMLCKGSEERSLFQDLFSHRLIQKQYICATKGILPKASFSFFKLEEKDQWVSAKTSVDPLFFCSLPKVELPISLAKVDLLTGKTHQIRKQFSTVRHFIINDKKYGDKKWNRKIHELGLPNTLYLRSYQLSFEHPINRQKIIIKAPWNRHWHKLFDLIGYCPI